MFEASIDPFHVGPGVHLPAVLRLNSRMNWRRLAQHGSREVGKDDGADYRGNDPMENPPVYPFVNPPSSHIQVAVLGDGRPFPFLLPFITSW